MFKRIKYFFQNLFAPKPTRPAPRYGDKVGNVVIERPAQIIKHTEYKVGDSYRLGEAIVTLHANKASMLAAIAKVDKKREEKHKRLRERAIDLMMMSFEELMTLKIDEWLAKRKVQDGKIRAIMGIMGINRYLPPPEEQISGKVKDRFERLVKDVKTKEKV